jgi:tRNA1Val (adenine37-N6)-methyltransferase
VSESTDDRFLGGRVIVRQPASGFRSGLDAVMLAAAVPAKARETILELGAGAGAASLCLATRVPDCTVTGIEFDSVLADIANENAKSNGVEARVKFIASDLFAMPREVLYEFDHVLTNPPFHASEGEASPDAARDMALRDTGRLGEWISTGMKRVTSGGTFTAIIRADRLGEALAALRDKGVSIFPLWPRGGEPAKRVIVQAVKGSRAPLALLGGLILHEADGSYTREADAILRGGASLALAGPHL